MNKEASLESKESEDVVEETEKEEYHADTCTTSTGQSVVVDSNETKKGLEVAGKQIVKEERKYGAITLQSYRQFFRTIGWVFWDSVFGAYLLQQTAAVMMNIWLSYWSSDAFGLAYWQYIGIYVGLVVGQLLFSYMASMMLAIAIAKTGEVLHRDALLNVLRARMLFFETTPLGRILTRFSKDVDSLDSMLHKAMDDCFSSLFTALGILVFVVIVIPWMAIVIPLLIGLCCFMSVFSRATIRELKRLESVKRADLVSLQSASLVGIETMRTFEGSMARCIAQSQARQDANNSPGFVIQSATRWVSAIGSFIGAWATTLASLVIVILRHSMVASQAGLVLSYMIQIGAMLNWALTQHAAMEMAMNSAERLDDYIHSIDHEEATDDSVALTKGVHTIDQDWPQHGNICFTNVWMRYRPELPWSLENVSFDIKAGEKVGIVGRTGAGKSSLIQVLFRLVEFESSPEAVGVRDENGGERDGEKAVTRASVEEAAILVDGQRIDHIALAELRSRMAIIPQDPTLFEGTFRFNLDPLSRFSDDELWRALEMAELKSYVQDQEGGLEALVAAQGENLSVGQRQLICLARALLIKSKVVVLDEATASVDLATDALIQKAIRVDLAGSTVVTIAHRLNTIIDFDKVLVLDRGQVVEFDSPHALLRRHGSLFGRLVDETGEQNATMLRTMAASHVSP
ncbi:Multidrug resistance-associated protein 1 [Actinomortierella ambigua]|nr:Multidrug resistance-associated protein 1 [Actinomortierella ambigua]